MFTRPSDWSICMSSKGCMCVCVWASAACTHVHTLQQSWCRTEQWWIGSHRPLVCSFPASSRWLRSSQGSKATTGSQQHPSLWSRDLHSSPSEWRRIESCTLVFDSVFIYLSLMEDALLYSLPEARYVFVIWFLICYVITMISHQILIRLNITWLLQGWTLSWFPVYLAPYLNLYLSGNMAQSTNLYFIHFFAHWCEVWFAKTYLLNTYFWAVG